MDFRRYQELAGETAVYPSMATVSEINGEVTGVLHIGYPVFGLLGEAGELAEKTKKIIRDKNCIIDDSELLGLMYELGDIMWYIARICTELNVSMESIAQMNIQKLKDRKERGVIQGSGDHR